MCPGQNWQCPIYKEKKSRILLFLFLWELWYLICFNLLNKVFRPNFLEPKDKIKNNPINLCLPQRHLYLDPDLDKQCTLCRICFSLDQPSCCYLSCWVSVPLDQGNQEKVSLTAHHWPSQPPPCPVLPLWSYLAAAAPSVTLQVVSTVLCGCNYAILLGGVCPGCRNTAVHLFHRTTFSTSSMSPLLLEMWVLLG